MTDNHETGKPAKLGLPRDMLRDLAARIARETATDKSGVPITIDGQQATIAEMILRQWATSGNAQLQRAFMEIVYGKLA